MFAEEIDESAAAATADIERWAAIFGKADRLFELGETVSLEERFLPVTGDLVVFAAERFWIHGVETEELSSGLTFDEDFSSFRKFG